jgi:di/tricarboxylate transporter
VENAAPSPLRLGRVAGLLAGLLAAAALLLLDTPLQHFGEWGARPARAAAVVACMAVWWLTEALPIYWTACLPLIAFPLLQPFAGGVGANARGAALPYVDPYIFLFAGGMAIAAAMQQHDLHRRLALSIMVRVGAAPRRLLGGVLLAIGAAFGLSVASPWDLTGHEAADTAAAAGIGAAIFLIVVHAISSGIGGYLAGRSRPKPTGLRGDETYFRDTAHGLVVWAVSAVATVGAQ